MCHQPGLFPVCASVSVVCEAPRALEHCDVLTLQRPLSGSMHLSAGFVTAISASAYENDISLFSISQALLKMPAQKRGVCVCVCVCARTHMHLQTHILSLSELSRGQCSKIKFSMDKAKGRKD